jgi:hypothetical protein
MIRAGNDRSSAQLATRGELPLASGRRSLLAVL